MHDLSTIPLAFAYHWHAVLPHACYLAEYSIANSTMHAFYYPFMCLLLNVYIYRTWNVDRSGCSCYHTGLESTAAVDVDASSLR